MTITLPARAGRRCHNVLNPLHSSLYFSAEFLEESEKIGFTDWNGAYLAARSAALGAPAAGTVTATFYNFSPELVAERIPAAWETATPATVLDTRLRAVDRVLRRLLGDESVASKEMAEAAELATRATEGCIISGRPLYAAESGLPVPDAPHLALWHAATRLREHRGDGHIALLTHAQLTGLEALVTHTASGRGFTPDFARSSRGWSSEAWSAAEERLRERGLLAGDGTLTEAGVALRKGLEDETDRVDASPYEHLGAAGVERLTELAGGFTGAALGAGAFPAEIFGAGRR
ncbi:SCO6745 family protein [Streptomyces boninensis]|uniref:SCO6745 family protein n=1 Tax=Streptomyces boninensis TaxID=2039455 RepID=UPI003B21B588